MQFALLISVIVAILLSAFLLLTHVQSFFRIKSDELVTGVEFNNAEIFKSLEEPNVYNDTLIVVDGSKKIKLVSNYHGAWQKVFSEIEIHNRTTKKAAYTGTALNDKTPNVYLSNTDSPLVVVGNARLEGNCYLSSQGIKAGAISGKHYQGSEMLYNGRIIESTEDLPEINPKWLTYLHALTKGEFIVEENIIPLKKENKNSFNKPSLLIYDSNPIIIGDEKIIGNICVQSETKITISSFAQLEDVILIAPTIIIDDDVKGKMQLIATKKIKIGKRCQLSYPSSATLLDQNKISIGSTDNSSQKREPNFTIDTNTKIEGAIIYLGQKVSDEDRFKINIKIEPDVEIIGEIYCQGSIGFQGTVKGSVYTNYFIADQYGSIFLNHIIDGKILQNSIPDYAGLPILNSKNTVAKWLY